MIQANELRIGNLVTLNNEKYHPRVSGETLMVTAINQTRGFENEKTHGVSLEHTNQKKNTYYDSYSQFVCYVEPIALTEEWLLKFGFEKDEYQPNLYKLGCFEIVYACAWNKKTPQYHIAYDSERDIYKNPIWEGFDCVHQLQNLYFALTGEEIEINI